MSHPNFRAGFPKYNEGRGRLGLAEVAGHREGVEMRDTLFDVNNLWELRFGHARSGVDNKEPRYLRTDFDGLQFGHASPVRPTLMMRPGGSLSHPSYNPTDDLPAPRENAMEMSNEVEENYRQAAAAERRLRWEGRFISARLAVRAALDVLRFGTGPAERVAAALAVSAPFFLAFLLFGRLQRLETGTVLTAAFVALASGFTFLVTFAVWGRDEAMRTRRKEARYEYWFAAEWRDQARADWEAAEEERKRQEEEEADAAARRAAKAEREAEAERVRRANAPVDCPRCYTKIHPKATICKHCRRVVPRAAEADPVEVPERKEYRGLAVFLSLIIPGLGQLVRGRIVAGLFWLGLLVVLLPVAIGGSAVVSMCTCGFLGADTLIASAVALPVLWILCAIDAATG